MTILQALAEHHKQLVRDNTAPPYGYSREKISYALVISREGKVVDITSLLDTSGEKPHPTLCTVPQSVKRTNGVKPNFLWDKTSYVLGVQRDPETKKLVSSSRDEHIKFKEFHAEMLAKANDVALQAVRSFLDQWSPDRYDDYFADDMLDTNIVFRLDGKKDFIHAQTEANDIWLSWLAEQQSATGFCLVNGSEGPLARLHAPIKGVHGAQSSGAALVSFNLGAFESFGKEQGANAPISEQAAFAYATALNALLARDSRRSIRIGDATTVFWAEATGAANETEDLFGMLMNPPTVKEEEAKVADELKDIAQGRPLAKISPGIDEQSRFHILGLSPNAARLSIRYYHADTFGAVAKRIIDHWHDLRIDPLPWKTPPAPWRLLIEMAPQRKPDRMPPVLGGALMRAILTGGRYPHSLFAAIIMRMRQDHDINCLRVAICKACLARDYRLEFSKEDVPVSLNPNETNVAYRLGRLFALYENLQRAALGNVNATIRDRYFGAASATPASIFPLLERGSGHHLASLRKNEKGGLAHWFDQEIDNILAGVDTALPRSLRLEEQGRFAIGYHHQRGQRGGSSGESTDETADTHTKEGE